MSDNFHGRMMNVPLPSDRREWAGILYPSPYQGGYREGHSDARRACAEIALEADRDLATLRAGLARVTAERDRLAAALTPPADARMPPPKPRIKVGDLVKIATAPGPNQTAIVKHVGEHGADIGEDWQYFRFDQIELVPFPDARQQEGER